MFSVQTDRLFIRPFLEKDLNAFYEYRSIPIVAKFHGFRPFTKEESLQYILQMQENGKSSLPNRFQWAIEFTSENKVIGDCGFYTKEDGELRAEIAITISPKYQQIGIAKETLNALIKELFSQMPFQKISAAVDVENESSIKLFLSCGFKIENLYEKCFCNKGVWRDQYMFGLAKNDVDLSEQQQINQIRKKVNFEQQ